MWSSIFHLTIGHMHDRQLMESITSVVVLRARKSFFPSLILLGWYDKLVNVGTAITYTRHSGLHGLVKLT